MAGSDHAVAGGVSDPLTPSEARRLFEPFRAAGAVVLAVSGGPDSVALMHLAAAVARDVPLARMTVATVDHGLRPGSERIAQGVAERAAGLGLAAAVLTWRGAKPGTGLQAAARQARYDLLVRHAVSLGATHLATAHTLDDQAETVLMRMARGSGPAGLSGMRRISSRAGLLHVRPFLAIAKTRLVAACEAGGWPFVLDPANADPAFARARWRRLLPALAGEGLDAPRLAQLARRLAETERAIDEQAARACQEARVLCGTGEPVLQWGRLADAPRAIRLRALAMFLDGCAREGRPRLGRLETAAGAIDRAYAQGVPLRRTLHGAVLDLSRDGVLRRSREADRRRGRPPIAPDRAAE